MADVEAGQVDEGEHVPINHLRRRKLFFLGVVLQVIGAVVPLAMEIGLMELKHPNAFRKSLLAVAPWTSLLSMIGVYIKRKNKDKENKKINAHSRILFFALGHLAFGFFVWLRAIIGWKFGQVLDQLPMDFAAMLLIISVYDLCLQVLQLYV